MAAALFVFSVLFGSVSAYADDIGVQSDFVFLMTDQQVLLSYDLPGTILENPGAFHVTFITILGAAPDPVDTTSGTFLNIGVTNPTQAYSDLNLFMVAGIVGNSLIGNWAYSDGAFNAQVRTSSSFVVGALVTFVLFGSEEEFRIEMDINTDTY